MERGEPQNRFHVRAGVLVADGGVEKFPIRFLGLRFCGEDGGKELTGPTRVGDSGVDMAQLIASFTNFT